MTVLLAFTVEHAARVTGVSVRRIRYWDTTGVLTPSLLRDTDRPRAYSRIYSFRDLVGLKTLGILRDGWDLPLQKLRIVGQHLQERFDSPWASLKFYVIGRGPEADILIRDPGSADLVSVTRPGQISLFDVEPIAREVERDAQKLSRRGPEQHGLVTRNRYVMGNTPVLAGTRIPTSAILEFHQAGYSTAAIIEQYPRLTPTDVDAALAYEITHRRKAS